MTERIKITKELGDDLSEKLPEMYASGESHPEVARKLGFGKSSFYKLVELSTKFADAKKEGEYISEAWWNELGRKGAKDGDINPPVWIFNMKNKFGWKDKTETDTTIKAEVKVDIDPEKLMKDRGIPIPEINNEDLDDE